MNQQSNNRSPSKERKQAELEISTTYTVEHVANKDEMLRHVTEGDDTGHVQSLT